MIVNYLPGMPCANMQLLTAESSVAERVALAAPDIGSTVQLDHLPSAKRVRITPPVEPPRKRRKLKELDPPKATPFLNLQEAQFVENLLRCGVDSMQGDEQTSSIIQAASLGFLAAVEILLEMKVDVNLQDTDGATALMHASSGAYVEIVRRLLERYADVNIQDWEGDTALMYAAGYGNREIVEILLQHQARVNTQNYAKKTALMYGATNQGITELLLQYKADVHMQDEEGDTAAMYNLYSPINTNGSKIHHLKALQAIIAHTKNFRLYNNQGDSLGLLACTHIQPKDFRKEICHIIATQDPLLALQSKELLHLKSLGHAFALQGEGEIVAKPNVNALSGKYFLESGRAEYWMRVMAKALQAMESPRYAAILPKASRAALSEILEFSIGPAIKAVPHLLARIRQNLPAIVLGGYGTHEVVILIWGCYFIICNKGGATRCPVEVHKFNPAKLNAGILQKIDKTRCKGKNAYKKLFFTHLPQALQFEKDVFTCALEKSGWTLGFQEVGNCSWESLSVFAFALFAMEQRAYYSAGQEMNAEAIASTLESAHLKHANLLTFTQIYLMQRCLGWHKGSDTLYQYSAPIYESMKQLDEKKDIHPILKEDVETLKSAILER